MSRVYARSRSLVCGHRRSGGRLPAFHSRCGGRVVSGRFAFVGRGRRRSRCLVGLLVLVAAGCGDAPSGDSRFESALAPANRNVDILFMVDDSSSMRLTQDRLIAGFPTLMDTLTALPGGLPN